MGTRWARSAALCASLAVMGLAPSARADVRGVGAIEVGVSLAEPTLVVGVEGGVRLDGEWTFLLEIDWNPWLTITGPDLATAGVLNIGVGVEHIYHDRTLRSALFLGTSTLLFESSLDQAGSTGFFIELLPVSIRIPLVADTITLRVDPVSMHLIVPAFGVLPLVRYEFRHVVSVEMTP